MHDDALDTQVDEVPHWNLEDAQFSVHPPEEQLTELEYDPPFMAYFSPEVAI